MNIKNTIKYGALLFLCVALSLVAVLPLQSGQIDRSDWMAALDDGARSARFAAFDRIVRLNAGNFFARQKDAHLLAAQPLSFGILGGDDPLPQQSRCPWLYRRRGTLFAVSTALRENTGLKISPRNPTAGGAYGLNFFTFFVKTS